MVPPETKVTTTAGARQQRSTPAELVDALNLVFGKQAHGRAVHAKGIVLTGRFAPSEPARRLSKAPHFRSVVPVTARFSNFAGKTDISDIDPLSSPRGLSLKFHLANGAETDLVTHSFNGFPASTADEFREFLTALGTSGPGARAPTPAERYLAAHPIAKSFLESQPPPPVSFATLAYFGVNAFKFTNERGDAVIGRYRIDPAAGIHVLPPEQRLTAPHDYLSDEIRQRVAREPIRFRLRVQLSESGDRVDDPSIAWPDNRPTVDIGTIEITETVEDNEVAERALLFLPGALPDGIEAADPMIGARNDAYPISYDRRHG